MKRQTAFNLRNGTEWSFDHPAYARAIEARMDAYGLTFRQAAEQAGLSAATILRMLAHLPDIRTFIKTCQWLGMTPDAFVIRPRRPHTRKRPAA